MMEWGVFQVYNHDCVLVAQHVAPCNSDGYIQKGYQLHPDSPTIERVEVNGGVPMYVHMQMH
jgi:hypothetical protein